MGSQKACGLFENFFSRNRVITTNGIKLTSSLYFIFNFRFRKPTNKELVVLVSVVAVAVFFILFYKEAWWARHGVVTKLKGVAP